MVAKLTTVTCLQYWFDEVLAKGSLHFTRQTKQGLCESECWWRRLKTVTFKKFWCCSFLGLHCSIRIRPKDQAQCSNLCLPITLIGRLPDAESHPLGSCNMPSASASGSPLNQHHKRSSAACGQQDTTVATRSWSIRTSRSPQHPRKRNPRVSDIVRNRTETFVPHFYLQNVPQQT